MCDLTALTLCFKL